MGFFKKRSLRGKKNGFQGMSEAPDESASFEIGEQPQLAPTTSTTSNSSNYQYSPRDIQTKPAQSNIETDNISLASQDVSLEELERLVNDLATCDETFGEKPARALRVLFALSEHHALHEINRIRMVREANGRLVPTLIQFLQMCEPSSSEQYLALLVLNNVSIPSENKRIVAIDCKGARVLSKMLCWYPDCSLICIILVNLCFCDSSLRVQLVEETKGQGSGIYLVEAFAYALQVSDDYVMYNYFVLARMKRMYVCILMTFLYTLHATYRTYRYPFFQREKNNQ